jgi:hypothetical protein
VLAARSTGNSEILHLKIIFSFDTQLIAKLAIRRPDSLASFDRLVQSTRVLFLERWVRAKQLGVRGFLLSEVEAFAFLACITERCTAFERVVARLLVRCEGSALPRHASKFLRQSWNGSGGTGGGRAGPGQAA